MRLGLDVGLEPIIGNLQALGIHRPLDPYPSLLLGAVSLSPLEMTQMYQTLANGGYSARITSYNVCYTKLLRVWWRWSSSRHGQQIRFWAVA